MRNEIHFHSDIELLEGNFKDKNNVPIMVDKNRMFGYFMQGENIVRIVYSYESAKSMIDNYKGETIEPIYYYCS